MILGNAIFILIGAESMATKAFLIAVSDYSKMGYEDLFGENDLFAVSTALRNGLNIKDSDIKTLGTSRTVSVKDFYNMIDDIAKCDQEDIIIFYFSGHGDIKGNIYCSDDEVDISSLVDFFKRLPQLKIIVIDSCHSGTIQIENETEFETNITRVNNNCALLASCRSYEASGYDDNKISCFTHFFCDAVINQGLLDEDGEKTIDDIAGYITQLAERWNKSHSIDRQQHPVYRSTLTGSIRFSVKKVIPYKTATYTYDCDEYSVCSIEPWHIGNKMQYRVNVILNDNKTYCEVSRIASEIVKKAIKQKVFNSEIEEQCFSDEHAKKIRCVFGYDASDLKFATWAYDATWTEKDENTKQDDELEVKEVEGYRLHRLLRTSDITEKEFKAQTEGLFSSIVNKAKEYIRIYREKENGSIDDQRRKELLFPISITINDLYYRLGMIPGCFDNLKEWSDERYAIVQDVLDMALPYRGYTFEKWNEPDRDKKVQDAIKRYQKGIDNLKKDNK